MPHKNFQRLYKIVRYVYITHRYAADEHHCAMNLPEERLQWDSTQAQLSEFGHHLVGSGI